MIRVIAATPADVRTVICYARTANPGTVGQRHLQRQRVKLHAEVAAQGLTVLEWIEDLHQSGTTTLDRPGLRHALALLADQQGWQLLTVTLIARSAAAPAATLVDRSPSPGRSRGGARR